MSRLAKKPIKIPAGVEFKLEDKKIRVKGKKGELVSPLHDAVVVEVDGNVISVRPQDKPTPMVGTTCKLISNLLTGVSTGFESRLELQGVGYRGKMTGSNLELSLGYSHPSVYEPPKGITIETPSNTEIVIKGMDIQLIGETAAQIRSLRPPEPYKGKGVRKKGEKINLKEVKKK